MIARGIQLLGLLGIPIRYRDDATSEEASEEKGKGDDEPAPWVPVLRVFNDVEARITMARLADEGIPCRMRQEGASRALPLTVGLLAQIDILVPEPLQERAEQIIDDLSDDVYDISEEPELDN